MKNIIKIIALITVLGLAGCGTTNTSTTTTNYDTDGNITSVITESSIDISDIATIANATDDSAVSITGAINSFTLGAFDYGLIWKSYEITRSKSPVKTGDNASTGSEALNSMATIVNSAKSSLFATSDGVGVNSSDTTVSEVAEAVAESTTEAEVIVEDNANIIDTSDTL